MPAPLLEVKQLRKLFPIQKGFTRRVVGHVRAVDDVSFVIHEGETLGLVGESGCGKTTTARCVLRAMAPSSGQILFRTREGEVVVGDRRLRAGDVLTIDGNTGEVFEGTIQATSEVVPEARTLLAWAQELGIVIGEDAQVADPSSVPDAVRKVSPDDCIRSISIKGFAPLQGVADAVLAMPDEVGPIVDQLAIDGLVATVAGAYRLTESGSASAAALLAAEQTVWGIERAVAALDAFLELDHRMKDAVTAWQLRDVAAQVVNDHADPEYDLTVLDRLAALHADTVSWLSPLEAGFPRLADYRIRLGRAIEQAHGGDQRYVASPRVDSYHSICFELHEDLIRLAGRSREDEVAAGRA